MGVANRDLDSSEQNYTVEFKEGAVATGATVLCGPVKSPGQLRQLVLSGLGLSGAPTYNVEIWRWTSAGLTVINPGSAITLAAAFGVSGGLIGATYAANSSLAALQVGDVLALKSGGANTAVTQLVGAFVVKATQDIKQSHSIT